MTKWKTECYNIYNYNAATISFTDSTKCDKIQIIAKKTLKSPMNIRNLIKLLSNNLKSKFYRKDCGPLKNKVKEFLVIGCRAKSIFIINIIISIKNQGIYNGYSLKDREKLSSILILLFVLPFRLYCWNYFILISRCLASVSKIMFLLKIIYRIIQMLFIIQEQLFKKISKQFLILSSVIK